MTEDLAEKIENKEIKIAIIGLGYIGLPTATLFAKAGFPVVGADIDENVVETVNAGNCHVREPGLQELVKECVEGKKLTSTTEVQSAAEEADVIIIIVHTPMNEKKYDFSAIEDACRSISYGLEKGKLVIIESTVPPGTTEELVIPVLEKYSGLAVGSDFGLAYCPERALPTRTIYEMQHNSRVVGGVDDWSAECAAKLYQNITDGDILIVKNLKTAELVKIIENIYRDVNIALANEIALICEELDIDVIEAIKAANHHPRVNLHMPGTGVGGHCIPKDPRFLVEKAKDLGFNARLIRLAREINEEMPNHTVQLIIDALNDAEKPITGSKVAVLGVAYKANIDDVRGSPAKPIIDQLKKLGANVVVHDPFAEESFGVGKADSLEETLQGADCAVVVTDHDVYRQLDMERVAALMDNPGAFVDGRQVVEPAAARANNLIYRGIGKGGG